MKRIVRRGTFKLSLLTEQLFAAHPEWLEDDPTDIIPDAQRTSVVISETSARDGIDLLVPDVTDEASIDAVLSAHVPSDKSAGELVAQKRAADRASGRAKLRGAGLTDDELDALLSR